jgi:hypothetical protein
LAGHHHGAMASRPDATVLRTYYYNVIRFFEDRHGCMGASCANDGFKSPPLGWVETLGAAMDGDIHLRQMEYRERRYLDVVEQHPCSVMRLPYLDFEWAIGTAGAIFDGFDRSGSSVNQQCLLAKAFDVAHGAGDAQQVSAHQTRPRRHHRCRT